MATYKYDEKNYNPPAPKAKVKITTDPDMIKIIDPGKSVSLDLEMLVDTGADICVISKKSVKRLESMTGREIPYDCQTVEDFNGETFCIKAYFLKLQHQADGIGDGETRRFLETKEDEGLLGRDVLNKYSIKCDGPELTLIIYPGENEI